MDELTAGEMPHAVGGRKRGSLFGKLGSRQDEPSATAAAHAVLPESTETPSAKKAPSDSKNFALKPDPSAMPKRLSIPADVQISGTLTSRSDTDIAGTIDGDVVVEAVLSLVGGSTVTGTTKATRCRLDGTAEGNLECTEDFDLGESGVLNADAISGNQMQVAGKINGGIRCGGKLHLRSTARVNGNIRARSLVVEEGAEYNGTCSMTSKQKK